MTRSDPRLTQDVIDSLVLDTNPYLSCDECFERIDTYAEQMARDPGYRDVAMEVHLRGCGACAEEAEALGELLATEE